MFDLRQLENAHAVVGAAMPPTPAYAWPLLSERLGATAIVKHENHTPIGAFKVRGGLVYVDRLKRERPDTPGLISATRGNHGQSLAFAAGRYGVPVTIYVPHGNSVEKNRAMRAFGADLVEHGEDFQAAREEAEVHARRDGLELVPSFHPDLVTGVATYALELLRTAPDIDILYVPIGQGSGICGCILTRDLLGLAHRDRRRAIDGGAVLCAVFRSRHGGEDEQQQYAGRRHGDTRARRGCACDDPQGRLPHRAGQRR